MLRILCPSLVFLCVLAGAGSAGAQRHHGSVPSLSANSRELFADAMALADAAWDPHTKFLHVPGHDEHAALPGRQMVRETSWYALGLLMRDASGDRQRAAASLDAILKQQYLDPTVKWYGTFRRTPEEAGPTGDAIIWQQYDPNWRVFIGTTFQLILTEFPDRLPPGMASRLFRSIDLALQGERKEKRLVPSYTNIALMYGALLDFAGTHAHNAAVQAEAAAWDDQVFALFKQYNAFNEYNSPTYYGTDLYGLAIWRLYGSSPRIKSMGSQMEARLWRDIADFYHPALRNIAGPYDRSYGMDMESYVALVGVWMRSFLPAALAPLPRIAAKVDHVADAWFAPPIVLLGAKVPADALTRLQRFSGPHRVARQITAERSATAWIGDNIVFGAESTKATKDALGVTQFHPATIQWRTPSGEIGWVQLVHVAAVDATADEHSLSIAAAGDVLIRIKARNADPSTVTAARWKLPGLDVEVTTDAAAYSIQRRGDFLDLTYRAMTHMLWKPTSTAQGHGRNPPGATLSNLPRKRHRRTASSAAIPLENGQGVIQHRFLPVNRTVDNGASEPLVN